MEATLITREEFEARRNGIKCEPEWWKKTRTYEVQMLEGREWVTKMSSDFEFVDDFRIVANNPYARILKAGVDITDKYRPESGASSTPYGSITPPAGPMPSKKTTSTYLKPAEYKALPLEEKQKLWEGIATLLDRKAKRAEIFEALNVSEATYDTIRLDIKAQESQQAAIADVQPSKVEEPKVITDNTPKQTAATSFQRPSLLRRR